MNRQQVKEEVLKLQSAFFAIPRAVQLTEHQFESHKLKYIHMLEGMALLFDRTYSCDQITLRPILSLISDIKLTDYSEFYSKDEASQ